MDILIFAAIAFYFFFKLNKQLGKIDDEEKQRIQENLLKKRRELEQLQKMTEQKSKEKVIGSSSTDDSSIISENFFPDLDKKSKQNLEIIFKSLNIAPDFFVNGAKSAFEMIIKSFAAGDLKELKYLLSDQIYKGFESAIKARNSEEKKLVTNIISIEKSEIISAIIVKNMASIIVKFTSKQINYITDKDGQIKEGKKDEINEVVDIWTFKKDLGSDNPNWIVSATSHE